VATASVDTKVFEDDDDSADDDLAVPEGASGEGSEKTEVEKDREEVEAIIQARKERKAYLDEKYFSKDNDPRIKIGEKGPYRVTREAMRRLDEMAIKSVRRVIPMGYYYGDWMDGTRGGRHSDDLKYLEPNDSTWTAGAIGAPVAISRTTEEEDERLWSKLNAVHGAQDSISIAMEKVSQTINNDIPYFPYTKTPENEDPFWKASDPESQAIAIEREDAIESFNKRNLMKTCVSVSGRNYTPFGTMSVRWEPGNRLVFDYIIKDRTKVDLDGKPKETRIPICMIRDEYLCKSFFGLFIGPKALDGSSKRKIGRRLMKVANGHSVSTMEDNVELTTGLPMSYGIFSLTDAIEGCAAGVDDGEFSEREFVLNGLLRSKLIQEEGMAKTDVSP
jgi:hypothetical protein